MTGTTGMRGMTTAATGMSAAQRPVTERATAGRAMQRALMARGVLTLLVLALSGCAGNLPRHIAEAPLGSPGVAAVAASPEDWVGQPVRWGGVIVSVQTWAEETRVELAARDLGGSGRPKLSDVSPGRFIARLQGFLDPSIFRADRELTVYGTLEPPEEGRIGERPYTYPVVRVQEYHLWPEYVPAVAPYDPWWDYYFLYDPFMRPFRPYYWPRAYWRSGFGPY